MGKVKRDKVVRKQEIGANPVSIPSLRNTEVTEGEGMMLETSSSSPTPSNVVQTILEQLRNPMVEERDSGLNSLSILVDNPKYLKELLENNILEIAAPLLMDPSLIVRHSAAGAFRNLSLLGPEVLDLMSTKEILRPLAQLLKTKYGSADWLPQTNKNANANPDKINHMKIDSTTDCFIQAVNALWNICEHSQEALDFFKNEGVFCTILKHLNVETFGLKVTNAVAQCLNTVTEGNKEIIADSAELEIYLQSVISEELVKETSLDPDWVLYQVLLIGITLNLHDGQISKLQPAFITKITQKLSAILDLDHIQEIKSYTSIIPLDLGFKNSKSNGIIHHPQTQEELSPESQLEVETKAENIKVLLDAQTMCLELLSNILFMDDDSDDSEDSEFEEEIEECVMEQNDDEEMIGAISLDPNLIVIEVHEAIKTLGLITKVTRKTLRLPENVHNILENNKFHGKPLLCKLNRLQSTSLLCFQNMIGAFSVEDLGGSGVLRNTWNDLLNYLKDEAIEYATKEESSLQHIDFLVSSTSCIRGIIQKILEEKCTDFFESLSLGLVTVFFELYQRNIPSILTNLIRIIGGLGVLVSRESSPTDEHKKLIYVIGEFLLNSIVQPTHQDNPICVAEALDTLFDVFSEDDYNCVIRELGMIQKLTNFVPQFKKMIRYYRKQLGCNKAIVETARSNLTRFIDYKIKHGGA